MPPASSSTPRRVPARSPEAYRALKERIDNALLHQKDMPEAMGKDLRRASTMIRIHLSAPKLKSDPAPTAAPPKK